MNILDTILEQKRKDVEERKSLAPVKSLEKTELFSHDPVSLSKYVTDPSRSGIIAEIKRKSPSKGIFHSNISIERISRGYVEAGASALSILTDQPFFGGSNEDLMLARKSNTCPILRKDFILDEYQIVEAKSIGADAILLIAAALPSDRVRALRSFAKSLGLEVLLEVHNEQELLDTVECEPELVGVNNRNLKTFDVSLAVSKALSTLIPKGMVKISESGIDSPEAIVDLQEHGFQGFLMGQRFMEAEAPEKAAKEFMEALAQLRKQTAT